MDIDTKSTPSHAASGNGRKKQKTESSSRATRRKLLDAATHMFAASGYNAVSIRAIAQRAGVNPALVNYHFGSKEALFEEAIRKNTGEHVADRIHKLTQAKRNGHVLTLEDILEIYIKPLILTDDLEEAHGAFARLHSVMVTERSEVFEDIASRAFTALNLAFVDELHRCLPHLSRRTIIWRLYALIGAMLFFDTPPAPPGILSISGGECNPANREELFRQLLPFFVQGMTAPEP